MPAIGTILGAVAEGVMRLLPSRIVRVAVLTSLVAILAVAIHVVSTVKLARWL